LAERRGASLEDYRNQAVTRATRLLRPYCPVFIAVSAASPLTWEEVDGEIEIVLSDVDSLRLCAFPNPDALDLPELYADHESYLEISRDLVRRHVRFGANNWTPVRARSDVDPINRNILATSEQLRELYRRGIYAAGENGGLEEAEQALIVSSLCARVDLPVNRVEVRTDDGGGSFDLTVAQVTLKELLMLRIYGDPDFGGDYGYDAEDVARARHNERRAAEDGLEARIEHPMTRRELTVRELLQELLEDLAPLVEGMDLAAEVEPLREMAGGGPNPASVIRSWFGDRMDAARRSPSGLPLVPKELVREWYEKRQEEVARDALRVAEDHAIGGEQRPELLSLISNLENMVRHQPAMPIRLAVDSEPLVVTDVSDRCSEVISLSAQLVRIPSVTNCPDERIDEVEVCGRFIAGLLLEAGCELTYYDRGRYPALVAGFPDALTAPVTLTGHFDVVEPDPDESQFVPRVVGDYLWGRGAADMKTVVASYLVWMRNRIRVGPPYPPINLLLVGNEENGEGEPFGTPHILADLAESSDWRPELMLVGERTGERGGELMGKVCPQSRGVVRMTVRARGLRGHSGTGTIPADLLDRLVEVRSILGSLFARYLTLTSLDGWETSARFPFLNVGTSGVYNITAGEGGLGIEVRPIPDDDVVAMVDEIREICHELGHELEIETLEAGVSCPEDNPHLARLLAAVEAVSGRPAEIGRKKPGSSARFAPGGNAVVWGQSGLGPHAADERHFIPSIEPFLEALDEFARRSMDEELEE
jgi:succinyl-diaminopimelate desuccinylase